MRTLDRYILRSFLFSAVMWFIVFMALRVVADLFLNMDEFVKLNLPPGQIVRTIVVYYAYQSLVYFTNLGGIIIVASAAFTLAMMNHTNELTAMLASGVSLFRVIVPVVVCSVLLSGLIVLDQEFVIPRVSDRLVRERDDVEGQRRFTVRNMSDSGGNVWFAVAYEPKEGAMIEPLVTVRDRQGRALASIEGRRAREANADGMPGWAFTRGIVKRLTADGRTWENPPRWDTVYSTVGPAEILRAMGRPEDAHGPQGEVNASDTTYGMVLLADDFEPGAALPRGGRGGTLIRPRFIFSDANGRMLAVFLGTHPTSRATWKLDTHNAHGAGYWDLEDGVLFFASDLSSDDLVLRRSDQWIQYMSTKDLTTLLHLKNVPNADQVLLTRHSRFVEPLNNLVMLLLGLPFILSRERNIKSSATLCLLIVGAFFAFIQVCHYLTLPPTLAAWLPVLLFGPVSAVMLDSVKT